MGGSEDGQNFHSISHPTFPQRLSATHHRPSTLTYVSNTNPYLKSSLQPNICNDEDIQVIQISTPNIEPIFLFNIYNESPPNDRTLPYTVKRILKYITLPERTILAGDFNAHHLWWNSKERRALRHETLINILENGDFDLINEEDTPTYHYSNGSSVLDLTFSTPQITDLVSNWALDEDNPISSDHEMIKYEITANNDNQVLKLRVRYNHSQRKNHTKFFANLFSHWLKTPLFRLHPLFYREGSPQTTFIMSSTSSKGKRKTTFDPDIPPFQHLVGVSPTAGCTVLATSSNKRP